MSDIKIIRNDRGLDFRRIEQFVKMFQDKCQKKSYAIDRQKSVIEKERKIQAFVCFELTEHVNGIESIDKQIEELKQKRKYHEDTIRDFTQGQKERYNTYDQIREGSPIQNFINEGISDNQKKRDEVWALNQMLSNEIWYARDLEQAIEIIQKFEILLDGISVEVKIENSDYQEYLKSDLDPRD